MRLEIKFIGQQIGSIHYMYLVWKFVFHNSLSHTTTKWEVAIHCCQIEKCVMTSHQFIRKGNVSVSAMHAVHSILLLFYM